MQTLVTIKEHLQQLEATKENHCYLVVDPILFPDALSDLQRDELIIAGNILPLFVNTSYASALSASPWLIEINHKAASVLIQVAHLSAGIVLVSSQTINQLQTSLAGMLTAYHDEHGDSLLRFYAPQVARALLTFKHHRPVFSHCSEILIPSSRNTPFFHTQWAQFVVTEHNRLSMSSESSLTAASPEQVIIDDALGRHIHHHHTVHWLAKLPEWQRHSDEYMHRTARALAVLQMHDIDLKPFVIQWVAWFNQLNLTHDEFEQLLPILKLSAPHAERLEQAKQYITAKETTHG